MRALLFSSVLVAGVLGIGSAPLATGPLSVDPHEIQVIDGDTIQVGNTVLQLAGIDAPEIGQACDHGGRLWPCGMAAAYELRKLVAFAMRPLPCFVRTEIGGTDGAVCMIGDEELSVYLLRAGFAVATSDSSPIYTAAERSARSASLGIWRGDFVRPQDWRKGKRLPGEANRKSEGRETKVHTRKWNGRRIIEVGNNHKSECLVKGTIGKKNKHIYYVILDDTYSNITLSTMNGERMFCSDDEARLAGWRREGEKEAGSHAARAIR